MSPPEFRRAVRERAGVTRQILSVVTTEHPKFGVYEDNPESGWIGLAIARPLRTGAWPLALSLRETVNAGDLGIIVAEYRYVVSDVSSGHEVFAYHLHPGKVAEPHLHLGAGAGSLAQPLYRAHFPTGGLVGLADVVRLLVADLGARPLTPGWERILDEAATPTDR